MLGAHPRCRLAGCSLGYICGRSIDSDGVPCRLGSWVPADKVKEEQPVDEDMPDAPPVKPEVKPHQSQEAPESLVREKTVGVGKSLPASALYSGKPHLKQPGS